MNKKVNIDKTVLLILYYRYKDYILPFVLVIISFFIFFQFVLPQFTSWLALRDEVSVSEQQISILSQNVDTLTKLNSDSLNSLLNTASLALPPEKDYAGVLNAIANAASISNVSLGDYSFLIGDLQGNGIQTQGGKLSITIDLTLNGGLNDAKKFVTALEKQLPISTITSLDVQGVSLTSVTVDFYYNPYPPKVFNENIPVQTLTTSQENFIQSFANSGAFTTPTPSSVITPTQ